MFFLETSIILKTTVLLRKICSNPHQTPLTLTSEPSGRHERKIFLNQVHKQHSVSVTISKSQKRYICLSSYHNPPQFSACIGHGKIYFFIYTTWHSKQIKHANAYFNNRRRRRRNGKFGLTCIITCIINRSLRNGDSNSYTALLSSSLGIILA